MDKKRFFSGGGDLFIFRENALMVVAALVSLMLQIISFFTTLDGAEAYFGATFAYAPLLFALAVQSVVYFLENSLRRRISFMKVVALMMAMCCSSYFSFVGIYNNINPPSTYLERTYSTYKMQLEQQRSELISKRRSEYSLAADEVMNYIISEYTRLTSEKTTLEQLSEQINSSSADTSAGMTAPRRSDYEEYEDYAAAYSAYIAGLSQGSTAEQQARIQMLLDKYGISDTAEISRRAGELSAQISLIEGTLSTYGGGEFYQRAEAMRAQLSRGIGNTAAQAEALYLSLSGETADIPAYTSAGSIELVLPEYHEIAAGDSAAVVRERLIGVLSAACDVLSAAGGSISAEEISVENIYTLPIYAVISGSFGADAVVSLLLAVLVDVLSLLFAMIFVRSKSILAAKNTDEAVISDPLLFERNIFTAVGLCMCAEGRPFSQQPDIDEVVDRLGEFIGRFHALDIVSEKGFTMSAPLDSLEEYQPLVAFLCQFGLAKQLSAERMSLLMNADCGESVLLKTKFILWVSEKTCTDTGRAPAERTKKAVTA